MPSAMGGITSLFISYSPFILPGTLVVLISTEGTNGKFHHAGSRSIPKLFEISVAFKFYAKRRVIISNTPHLCHGATKLYLYSEKF